MSAKPLPKVVLEPVFVRDHERRIKLVIELLERELQKQHTPSDSTNIQTQNTEVTVNENSSNLCSRIKCASTTK